jgi:hypothetical protein
VAAAIGYALDRAPETQGDEAAMNPLTRALSTESTLLAELEALYKDLQNWPSPV